MKKDYMSLSMSRRGVLLPIVVFLILGIAAVFPLLTSMSQTTLSRTQYSEEWARIQWAIEGANQKQLQSTTTVVDPYSGVVTTIATFTYPESGGSFDVAVAISEGRTLLGRHRNLSATAKAYRNGVDAGYNLSGLAAATVSVPGVAAGGEHSFAWKKDGTLYSWGRNSNGQLGLADASDRSTAQQTQNGACPSNTLPYYTQGWMVAGGGSHTVALDYFGKVYSWGRNNRGQLGHSGTTNVNVPQTVISGGSQLQNVSDLTAGDEFSLALTTSGNVMSWGDDLRGQLGYNPPEKIFTSPPAYMGAPQTVVRLSGSGALSSIVGIAAGARHALAIDIAGNVFGWGDNGYNQLGAAFTDTYSRKPIKVNDTIATWVAQVPSAGNSKDPVLTQFNVSVGHFIASFSVDVDRDYNEGGWNYDVIRLTNINTLANTDILPTSSTVSGSRYTWSYLKNQTTTDYSIADAGTYTVRIIRRYYPKSLFNWTWGEENINSRWYKSTSTDATFTNKGVFSFYGQPVEEPTNFFGIAAGGDFSMAVRRDGSTTKLYTWGRNNQGQLGHGDTDQRNRMAPITSFPPTGEKLRTIAAGREHGLALTESGKVYSWGNNTNGQLGRTTSGTTNRTPGQIPATSFNNKKITGIAAGSYHSLAIDEDGKVYGWGLQNNGRVGNGSTSGNRTTPAQLTGFP
ncbi:MAG TPA: hypothetical protein PLK28_13575 [Candidatus Rifleibacterium sp.]|nr:hypothetical protein [Candidatus Rifleibacterium sp.]